MTINLTVLVQLFHFLVAYFILEKVLFGPAVAVIKERDLLFDQKRCAILDRKQKVELLRFHMSQEKKAYQEELQTHIPPFEQALRAISIDDIYKNALQKEVPFKQTQKEEAYKQKELIKSMIIERIAHD